MTVIRKKVSLLPLAIGLFFVSLLNLSGQAQMPDILNNGTLQEQLEYIQGRTQIYNNFRAIREDMFQKVKNNSLDSLSSYANEIRALSINLKDRDAKIDSLYLLVTGTRDQLSQAVKERDSLRFLGIPMHKAAYNLVMWLIIAGLLFLLGSGFMLFKRNQGVMARTGKDLAELREEFEMYRIKTREQREKMVMDHFNEVRKLKEK